MSRTTEWHNVEFELSIELTPELTDTMKPEVQTALGAVLGIHAPDWIEETPIEIRIEAKSSGDYNPGRWGGTMEDAEPPSLTDDREMDSVYLMTKVCERVPVSGRDAADESKWRWHCRDDTKIALPLDLQESLFAHFQKQVDDEELPGPYDPDYDDLDD